MVSDTLLVSIFAGLVLFVGLVAFNLDLERPKR